MPETDDCGGQVSKRSWVVFGYKLGRRRRVSNLSVFGLLAAGRWFCFLLVGASANGIVSSDSRLQRAGNIAGLEGGRISLERLTKMMSTSVHVELAGSEDTFRRLLDHEWDRFSSRADGVRSTFLVCNAPGRKNAKRLREIAGADSLVETLYRRKREPTCSVASLDRAAVSLVASEGGGETFSLEPLPHLAKLSATAASDPSPAALLLSFEAGATVRGGEGNGELEEQGEEIDGDGSRKRRRRLGASSRKLRSGIDTAKEAGLSTEQRARVFSEVAGTVALPTTRRLIDEGVRGFVDAIEIILTLHHERRSKADTEELARRWLSEAQDQASLAKTLREHHFWSKHQERPQQEENDEEEADQRRREIFDHEERQHAGWTSLLGILEDGQGVDAGGAGLDFCAFDTARFTVSPNGKKILIHRPHEMSAVAAHRAGSSGGGADGDQDGGSGKIGEEGGCMSALLAYVSVQPEAHYVTVRRKSATMNFDAAWVTQTGVTDATSLWDEDLQGQDEIIGVADTGVDVNHCFFREDDGDSVETSEWENPVTDLTKRKVVQYIAFVDDFDEAGGHGTHVAGTLVGAESGEVAGDGVADGMAFQGKIAVFDFGDSDNSNALTTPDEVDTIMLQPAYDAGARVHSNSWDTISVEYTSISKEVDEFVYTHQDFLVVFAAGNCGDASATDDLIDSCDVLDTDSGTVLSPAQAKNVVAVGSSESGGSTGKDIDTVSYFSSKGYTIDGRIKPDVVAPGDPIYSSYADPTGESCDFGYQTGTSMATPVVAGNAAIARQYFREGWYNTGNKNISLGFDPSAALLKATLINSAQGMSYAGVNPETSTLDVTLTDPPDESQGHGRVTMVQALNINSTVGIFFKDWEEISEGETLEYEVSLYEDADTDKDLRITLVWTEPAAATGSTTALLHDLDLVVEAQSTGTVYYPNGADEPDEVNNVEKIIITDTTQAETYYIRVSCEELSEADSQAFALIANGEFIKTNDLPTAPDPSTWLDLVDQAADTFLTWKFGIILALAVAVCCVISCAFRRCQKNRRQKVLESRYRQAIIQSRGGIQNGRKTRKPLPISRPQPYPGPLRAPGELMIAGSTRYNESWRRPGPGSISGRSARSQGSLLTGSGAMIPRELLSSTTPSTPPQDMCPECGLQLPDAVQLVSHVETKHGGRATRRNLADVEMGERKTEGSDDILSILSLSETSKSGSSRTAQSARDLEASSFSRAAHASAVRSAVAAGPTETSMAVKTAETGSRKSPGRTSKRRAISPTRRASPIKPRPSSPDSFGRGRRNPGDVANKDAMARVRDASRSIPNASAASQLPVTAAAASGNSSRDQSGGVGSSDGRGRSRSRRASPGNPHGLEVSEAVLQVEESWKFTRTKSLDRMSSLSSRAFARTNNDFGMDSRGSVPGGSRADASESSGRRRSRRSADAGLASPADGKLTAENLEAFEGGYPGYLSFSPVMSPSARAKEPAYSPVARTRAGELDVVRRPVGRTRKFFRQLSGEL